MLPPLAGTTVVELCNSVAGPYAGLVLSQLGAAVTKVERRDGGDDTRGWRPPEVNGTSAMFAVMNAGKASVALDLADADDRRDLDGMLAEADVLLMNLRPASQQRLGLDEDGLARTHPHLVVGRISAFGARGPYREDPGYDPLLQAFTGLMSVTGEDGRPPVRVGTSIIDMGTGLWTALGVLAALRHRDATGEASPVATSLLETGIAWLPYQIAGASATGTAPRREGSRLAMLAPYQAFSTRDGYVVVAAGNDRLWLRLCDELGRDDLRDDEALATNAGRVAARERLAETLEGSFAADTTERWVERLRAAGVPVAPVQTVPEAVSHEQVAATGILGEAEPGLLMPGLPLSLGAWRPRPAAGPPPPPGRPPARGDARDEHQG